MLNIFKTYTLDDLTPQPLDVLELRKRTSILIVDDEPFDNENCLKSLGFNITKKDNWHNLKDAEPYDIIVSDNKGVADAFNTMGEGAFVLSEIHKNYPQKGCIIYSHSMMDLNHTSLLEGIKQMKKNDDTQEWAEILSETINDIYNPIEVWRKIEKFLYDQRISRKNLRKIEDKFVRCVLKGKLPSGKWYQRNIGLQPETLNVILECFKLAITAYSIV